MLVINIIQKIFLLSLVIYLKNVYLKSCLTLLNVELTTSPNVMVMVKKSQDVLYRTHVVSQSNDKKREPTMKLFIILHFKFHFMNLKVKHRKS